MLSALDAMTVVVVVPEAVRTHVLMDAKGIAKVSALGAAQVFLCWDDGEH
jgi:hypothetical protein